MAQQRAHSDRRQGRHAKYGSRALEIAAAEGDFWEVVDLLDMDRQRTTRNDQHNALVLDSMDEARVGLFDHAGNALV